MREECLTCKKVSYENSKFYDNNESEDNNACGGCLGYL